MKLVKVLPIIMIICVIFTSVFAIEFPGTDADYTYGQSGSSEVKTVAQKTWGTVSLIVQILAVAAVVFAGLRYMFTSADQRADIKKSMGILALGAILVFATIPVLNFVVSAVEDVTGLSTKNSSSKTIMVSWARHNAYWTTQNIAGTSTSLWWLSCEVGITNLNLVKDIKYTITENTGSSISGTMALDKSKNIASFKYDKPIWNLLEYDKNAKITLEITLTNSEVQTVELTSHYDANLQYN